MFPILLISMLLNPFRPCEGSPAYQEEYRGNYIPNFVQTAYGIQVIAPDTPYVAAAGRRQLYFIDMRFDSETASHIKMQIEKAAVPKMEEYISIDEIAATAEIKNGTTGETTFVFDPAYARVLFARGINKRNPDLKLPEHAPAGDWLVTYDVDILLAKRMPGDCSEYGCTYNEDCLQQKNGNCDVCPNYRVDNERDRGLTNAIGACCSRAVDTAKQDGETDTEYYQRMDKLHWG